MQIRSLTPNLHGSSEVKFTEAPEVTNSMRNAAKELNLDHLWVVYPGAHEFPMDQGITALPMGRISQTALQSLSWLGKINNFSLQSSKFSL